MQASTVAKQKDFIMIHSSEFRWNGEGWNIGMLAGSPELCVDSLGAALFIAPQSLVVLAQPVAYKQWIIISYIFSLELAHSILNSVI